MIFFLFIRTIHLRVIFLERKIKFHNLLLFISRVKRILSNIQIIYIYISHARFKQVIQRAICICTLEKKFTSSPLSIVNNVSLINHKEGREWREMLALKPVVRTQNLRVSWICFASVSLSQTFTIDLQFCYGGVCGYCLPRCMSRVYVSPVCRGGEGEGGFLAARQRTKRTEGMDISRYRYGVAGNGVVE